MFISQKLHADFIVCVWLFFYDKRKQEQKNMWQKFNENPCGRNVGDCAVRAVSVALGVIGKLQDID